MLEKNFGIKLKTVQFIPVPVFRFGDQSRLGWPTGSETQNVIFVIVFERTGLNWEHRPLSPKK